MTNKEAVEIIKTARAEVEWEYPMDYAAAFDRAIEALEREAFTMVPSAQPKQNWIPVSEGLPKPREDVWCNSHIGQIAGYYDEYVETWYASFGQGRDYLELTVNAWMPLPQSYKAEVRDKE